MSQGKEVVLESEVQVLSRLRHPNIVKLYDVIDAGSILCLVLELVEVSDWHIAWITAQLFSLFLFFQCPIVFLFSLSYFVLFFVFFFFFKYFFRWIGWRAVTCLMPSPPPASSANRKPSGWRRTWRQPWRTFTRSASFIVTSNLKTFS